MHARHSTFFHKKEEDRKRKREGECLSLHGINQFWCIGQTFQAETVLIPLRKGATALPSFYDDSNTKNGRSAPSPPPSSYLPECVAAWSMTVSEVIKVGAATLLVFDALWFFRLVATKVATYFKPKLKPLEESRVYSICTTHDIDFNFHMNNAR